MLLRTAIMHPLGRVVLGTLYRKQYDSMVQQCTITGESLLEQERRAFTLGHCEGRRRSAIDLEYSGGSASAAEICVRGFPGPLAAAGADTNQGRASEAGDPHWTHGDRILGNVGMVGSAPRRVVGKVEIDVARGNHRDKQEKMSTCSRHFMPKDAVAEPISSYPTRVISYCDLSQASCGFLNLLVSMGIRLVKRSCSDLRAGTDKVRRTASEIQLRQRRLMSRIHRGDDS